MRELLDKNRKKKEEREKTEKEENYRSLDWPKKALNLRVVSHCFLVKVNES